MLNHRSLVFSTVVIIATLHPGKGFSQVSPRNGGKVTRNGNVIELSAAYMDTVVVVDPATNEEVMKISIVDPHPIKVNGNDIALKVDKAPYFTAPDKNVNAYLIRNLNKELCQLKDGKYRLNVWSIVIDEKGMIVYFDFDGVSNLNLNTDGGVPVTRIVIDKPLQARIIKHTNELINALPAYIPAMLNGKNVAAYTNDSFGPFTVKGHVVKPD